MTLVLMCAREGTVINFKIEEQTEICFILYFLSVTAVYVIRQNFRERNQLFLIVTALHKPILINAKCTEQVEFVFQRKIPV